MVAMKSKLRLRAAVAVIALTVGVVAGSGRALAQVECAGTCLSHFADCLNGGSAGCEDPFIRCLEDCLGEGLLQ